jgi:predicted MFS family arabinose efflux permease
VLVAILLVVECVMYSAVTPLLPHYAAAYGLSKTAAGVLAARYSIGFLGGAPLGGWMAARAVRGTVIAGLVLFGAAALAFGLAGGVLLLDAIRTLQGIAGGIIWGGGLVWLVASTPRALRGAALGKVFAASTAGTLMGPLLGTLALAASGGAVFGGVGGGALLLGLYVGRLPAPPSVAPLARVPLTFALRRPPLLVGAALFVLVACTLGTLGVLVPLRLAAGGSSGLGVGATFVAAAALAAMTAPLAGAIVDGRGPLVPVRAGLIVMSASVLCLGFAHAPLIVAILTVLCVAGGAGACLGPCVAYVTATAERMSVSFAAATATLNMAFAVGESVGATAGPRVAQAAGDLPALLSLGSALAVAAGALAAGIAHEGGRWLGLGDRQAAPANGD